MATLGLFIFMGSWDQLLRPMIVAANPVMAPIVISVIPVVMAFLLTQRQFIAGAASPLVESKSS